MHFLPRPMQLVELRIYVGSYNSSLELSQFNGLEALDATLQPELFESLQAVQLDVAFHMDRNLTKPMLAVIKTKLPGLFARNIIEVLRI